ncbi:family 9 carbohydrate esterase [Podospora australis]|uniref:N-acetylglucosamine-6-phosphate deacetylase n=1 Tax=Podospora australis TaxID=1536484 RepID=A0AAN6WYT6_9PEZI|nr:family 9 carbohydrate esterase [Podospora australis]
MVAILQPPPLTKTGITKLTNCWLVTRDSTLIQSDLWVGSTTGKILNSQAAFYDDFLVPEHTIDLQGRIVSPGFIDCQLNGAFGFNFSTVMDDMSLYRKELDALNKKLLTTGVTSYLPTVTSQAGSLYHKVLPYLVPSGSARDASVGAESLGAHVEGPFLNPHQNGIHNPSVLQSATSIIDLEQTYGFNNFAYAIKMITVAPEVANMTSFIPDISSVGIIVSIGHSEATLSQATAAVEAGATMITHLFNAMTPPHHRRPGIFGLLSSPDLTVQRPYFGIIADGNHLHPSTVTAAWRTHPEGFILVTDAMHVLGLPDGHYSWTNGSSESSVIVKKGDLCHLEGNEEAIAGSAVPLIECVNNFMEWSGASVAEVLNTVTATPAKMLGLEGIKGSLEAGADADFVVLSFKEEEGEGRKKRLGVDEVWKFGERVV